MTRTIFPVPRQWIPAVSASEFSLKGSIDIRPARNVIDREILESFRTTTNAIRGRSLHYLSTLLAIVGLIFSCTYFHPKDPSLLRQLIRKLSYVYKVYASLRSRSFVWSMYSFKFLPKNYWLPRTSLDKIKMLVFWHTEALVYPNSNGMLKVRCYAACRAKPIDQRRNIGASVVTLTLPWSN